MATPERQTQSRESGQNSEIMRAPETDSSRALSFGRSRPRTPYLSACDDTPSRAGSGDISHISLQDFSGGSRRERVDLTWSEVLFGGHNGKSTIERRSGGHKGGHSAAETAKDV